MTPRMLRKDRETRHGPPAPVSRLHVLTFGGTAYRPCPTHLAPGPTTGTSVSTIDLSIGSQPA